MIIFLNGPFDAGHHGINLVSVRCVVSAGAILPAFPETTRIFAWCYGTCMFFFSSVVLNADLYCVWYCCFVTLLNCKGAEALPGTICLYFCPT